jgi:hypothetical protein
VRAGGLRMSMRFMGPEESGVVAVSRTPGLCLVGVFAVGASLSDAASSSEGGGEEADGSGKGGYSGTWRGQGLLWEFFWLFTFFPALGSSGHPGYHDPTCFLRWSFSHVGQLRTAACQQSIQGN